MSELPTGTVTFLFTDIEGSTKLAQGHPAEWDSARQRHHIILSEATQTHQGYVFQIIGDAFCVAFPAASNGLQAALAAQRALQAEAWGETPILVRMGLHTGAADAREGDYHGYLTLAQVQRVMSVAHGGQTLVSNATAGLLTGQLPDGVTLRDLGEHRLNGLLNPEHLWQLVTSDLPSDFPPLKSLSTVPNNLPVQLTSFIGREREMTEVKRLLTTTRLLTLTGSGGTGKTRLSLAVASDLLDQYPDGVWFIELAPLTDPALVPQTVASVLGVREEPGRPILATLTDHLRDKHLLLVLDNCEHLIEASAKCVDALLHAAPQLRSLASSREALGIAGETAYRVPSLPSPNPKEAIPSADLAKYDAVRLWVERAAAAKSDFSLTSANAPAVAQICYRLDGIPLAIELAAARIKVFSAEQIAARLDDRFRLLTGGSRTALPRQQTLRALIDWSYSLLSESERVLLRRLSVFAGGWTFDAAEAVCADEGQGGILSFDVLDLLTRLIDKSLVVEEEKHGEARYRMLETIRQFGRDKLLESNEGEAVRSRHLTFFARFAAEADPMLIGAEQVQWLERFEAEHDNLRAAIEWSPHDRNPALQLQLPATMELFWYTHGYHTEGVETLTHALATTESRAETPQVMHARMRAIIALTKLLHAQGKLAEAQPFTAEAVALAERFGDQEDRAWAYRLQGVIAAHQGDYVASHDWLIKGLDAIEDSGDKYQRALTLWVLGDEAYLQSDYARAQILYAESAAIFKERGDKNRQAYPLRRLGQIAIHQGELDRARAFIVESVANNLDLMERQGIIGCLAALAALNAARGQWIRTATLFGCVAALLKSMRMTLFPVDQIDYDRNVAIARGHLDAAAFEAAWAAGQALDLDQAIQYAQADEA